MNAVRERQLLLAFSAQACISHLLGLVGRPGGGHAGGGLVQAPEIGKKKGGGIKSPLISRTLGWICHKIMGNCIKYLVDASYSFATLLAFM